MTPNAYDTGTGFVEGPASPTNYVKLLARAEDTLDLQPCPHFNTVFDG